MLGHVRQDGAERTHTQRAMKWDRDVVRAVFARSGEANVATALPRWHVAEAPERPDEFHPAQVARQSHGAKTSSRTT